MSLAPKLPTGTVTHVWVIGPYSITAYQPWIHGPAGQYPSDTVEFRVSVHGHDTGQQYPTLEAAIVGAIAYAVEGPNHRADSYFMKMLAPAQEG